MLTNQISILEVVEELVEMLRSVVVLEETLMLAVMWMLILILEARNQKEKVDLALDLVARRIKTGSLLIRRRKRADLASN